MKFSKLRNNEVNIVLDAEHILPEMSRSFGYILVLFDENAPPFEVTSQMAMTPQIGFFGGMRRTLGAYLDCCGLWRCNLEMSRFSILEEDDLRGS